MLKLTHKRNKNRNYTEVIIFHLNQPKVLLKYFCSLNDTVQKMKGSHRLGKYICKHICQRTYTQNRLIISTAK